jgi:glucose-6-phosphate 1-dehydrogenase
MVQNHLLQLLCLIAMEPPVTFDAAAGARREAQGDGAIRPIDPAKVDAVALRGQYTAASSTAIPCRVPSGEGRLPELAHGDLRRAEALRRQLALGGVPFFVRTGKRLPKRASEIVIRFHRTPHMIFRRSPAGVEPNTLSSGSSPTRGSR